MVQPKGEKLSLRRQQWQRQDPEAGPQGRAAAARVRAPFPADDGRDKVRKPSSSSSSKRRAPLAVDDGRGEVRFRRKGRSCPAKIGCRMREPL